MNYLDARASGNSLITTGKVRHCMELISICYRFMAADGSKHIFDLLINAENLELQTKPREYLPDWTILNFHQCPHCTLALETHPHCPLALNLVEIVENFEGLVSYDEIHLDVITQERRISQKTTMQRGISSLMGLVIATSGCPHTAFFKPMARFHLPLSTVEETIYRATSTYLLAQYFMKKEGYNADLELIGLTEFYNNIQTINTFIADRLRDATKTDSSLNAIILLDAYAKALPYVIEKSLEEIRYAFAPYLSKMQSGYTEEV